MKNCICLYGVAHGQLITIEPGCAQFDLCEFPPFDPSIPIADDPKIKRSTYVVHWFADFAIAIHGLGSEQNYAKELGLQFARLHEILGDLDKR